VRKLDPNGHIRYILSRDSTRYKKWTYCRDLTQLDRDLSEVIYLSVHALETCLQEDNAYPVRGGNFEEGDRTLLDAIPILKGLVQTNTNDLRPALRKLREEATMVLLLFLKLL
ncbi:Mitochondrial import inner membrane translocase subunit tim50, partial [Thalictrum thalictroides]